MRTSKIVWQRARCAFSVCAMNMHDAGSRNDRKAGVY